MYSSAPHVGRVRMLPPRARTFSRLRVLTSRATFTRVRMLTARALRARDWPAGASALAKGFG